MKSATLIRLTAALGALSVGIGAFAAHGLEQLVSPPYLETFDTGVRYQFYHTFAIGLAACLSLLGRVRVQLAVGLWLVGMFLFCGSLYLLSLREVLAVPTALLGPITPIGGLFLIGGWAALFFSAQPRHH